MASETNVSLKEYLHWEEYLMGIAVMASNRCKNEYKYRRGGACLASSKFEIIAVSFDGFPNILTSSSKNNDDYYTWKQYSNSPNLLECIMFNICHAESNAILYSKTSLEESTLYTVFFPCHDCAKMIVQTGITRIVYLQDILFEQDGIGEREYMKAIYMLENKKVTMDLFKDLEMEVDQKKNLTEVPREKFQGSNSSVDFSQLNETELLRENDILVTRNLRKNHFFRVSELIEVVGKYRQISCCPMSTSE